MPRLGIFAKMKKALRLFVAILLSGIILVTGTGMTFGKMVCIETGYRKLDYKQVEDCCLKNRKAPVIVKDVCCDITNIDLKTDGFVTTHFSFDAAPVVLHSLFITSLFDATAAPVFSQAFLRDHPLPPPGGREHLHRTHLLLV